jgi:hypothetical protein
MNASHSPLSRTFVLTAFALVALTMAGCTKKVTVDPSYTMPEGRYHADARLVVYPDLPVTVQVWRDTLPEGASDTDYLLYTETSSLAPGAMHGAIVDGTPATAFEVLRKESNGGFDQLGDYLINPCQRFLESQWELYVFQDSHPSSYLPATYVGRGVVAGQVTTSSPLTNLGEQGAVDLVTPTNTVAPLIFTGDQTPADSNFTITWQTVTGAVGYWIQIYDYTGSTEQRLLSASPAPFVTTHVRNMLVAYAAAPATSYQIGTTADGVMVLTHHPLLHGVQYSLRISAVNDEGRMIAFTYGPNARLQPSYPGLIRYMYTVPETGASQARYMYFSIGAYTVTPTNNE